MRVGLTRSNVPFPGGLPAADHQRCHHAGVSRLEQVLVELERYAGPPDPLPATDGWELVLRENVAYLVDDETRDRCMAALRHEVGLEPEAILSAPSPTLESIVAGMRPRERAERLRRCAELRLADAKWRSYPGIGRPGVERIELFTGTRPVLALESNGVRVLYRLGYGDRGRSYDATYRAVQGAAATELAPAVPPLQRAHQLLRRHGQSTCTRLSPACESCPVRSRCAAGTGHRSLADPFVKT
jgi:endonuclease III